MPPRWGAGKKLIFYPPTVGRKMPPRWGAEKKLIFYPPTVGGKVPPRYSAKKKLIFSPPTVGWKIRYFPPQNGGGNFFSKFSPQDFPFGGENATGCQKSGGETDFQFPPHRWGGKCTYGLMSVEVVPHKKHHTVLDSQY